MKFLVCPRLRFSSQIWIIWPKSFCYAYLRCYGIRLAKNIVKYFLLNKGFIPVCTVQWLMSFKDFVRQLKATQKTILNISILRISTVNIISPVLELVSNEGHYFIDWLDFCNCANLSLPDYKLEGSELQKTVQWL